MTRAVGLGLVVAAIVMIAVTPAWGQPGGVVPKPKPEPEPKPEPKPEPEPEPKPKPEPEPEPKPEPEPEPEPKAKPEPKPEPKAKPDPDPGARPAPSTTPPAGTPAGLTAGVAIAKFLDRAVVSGFSQIDYLRRQISLDELSDGTGEPLNEDLFVVRRARLRVDRDWRYVGVTAITELFVGSTARPVGFDIHAQLPGERRGDPPLLQFRVGMFPVPFGFENFEQIDPQRFFGERTLFAYGLVPGRFDLGAAVSGHIWGIDWNLAVQNGEPRESGEFAYEDPNAAKDIAARVRVTGGLFSGVRGAAAVSLLYGRGFSPGTPPTKDTFEWQDLNEDGRVIPSELIPIPGSSGRPSQNFDRWALGADVQLWTDVPRLGELMIYGELAAAVNFDRGVAPADPVLLGRDQRGFGFYVAAIQQLTKHATAGVRFEQYEPNADTLELFDGMTVVTRRRFRTVTAGVSGNLALSPTARARVLLEYEYQRNSLGRDNRGRPAQLDNDTLRVRAEVAF